MTKAAAHRLARHFRRLGYRVRVRRHRAPAGGGSIAIHEDVTERKRAEERIAFLAHHDTLTKLPNRAKFRAELTTALARCDRGESLAVMCVDLDYFKTVKDTLGHPVGDALLQDVARRLSDCIGEADTIARLGGDEFAIVQIGAPQPVSSTSLATKIIRALSMPYQLHGHQVVTGASIGIAVAPTDGCEPDALLKNADLALYRAKEDGRSAYRFFEPEMDAKMQARRALELDLRKALALGEFELYHQPLMQLDTNRITGFEALLRWHHPERGLIPRRNSSRSPRRSV
jgi:diguanylate cyclase (GGDEF)-like protein